ncbi:MAG: DUF503 domain-containing protein [Gammaproteobacteria bacterium]|nr:DUF503 domain-containing protein [Gammaproteobacteria bacterium]MCW9003973.1 DUF503 domain-containing protein [Gammaproteobacteria bacterium]MCW9055681.1 DUF503 domain-containing protein [Gammaproteobacteria bacterium]
MSGADIYILLLIFELRISYAQSLKDKRRVIKGLKDRLSSRFNISIAELGELDNWNQSILGVVLIANDRKYLDGQASLIESMILEVRNIELITVSKEWL